jgi:hypothetical protein
LFEKAAAKRQLTGIAATSRRIFVEWLDIPLREYATDPARVARKHDDVTKERAGHCELSTITLAKPIGHRRPTILQMLSTLLDIRRWTIVCDGSSKQSAAPCLRP